MTATQPRQPTAAPPDARAATAILGTMVRMSAVRGRLHGFEPVKVKENRIVARAVFDGRPVFLKAFLGGNAPARAGAVADELAVVGRAMRRGPYGVTRCLFAARRVGFVVLSPVPGEPLAAILRRADDDARRACFRSAGGWLAAYCAPRRQQRGFDAARFLRGREAWLERFVGNDRTTDGIADRLAARIACLAGGLEGSVLDVAASHGDFIGRNLRQHGRKLCGFDVDDSRPMAVAEEVAHFLVDYQTSVPRREGGVCGIEAEAWDAMRASGVLPDAEWETTLPLYIALQVERRWMKPVLRPQARKRVETIARRILDHPSS